MVPLELVDATHALKRSAGVSNSNVSGGRSLNSRATLFNVTCECSDKSVPLGNPVLASDLFFHKNPVDTDFEGHKIHINICGQGETLND